MGPKEKRNAAVKRQQELVSSAKNESRDLTPEEKREFEELQGTINTLTKEIEQLEKDEAERKMENERTRTLEISQLCRQFGMDAENYIKSGATVESVRAAVIEKMAKEQAPVATATVDVVGNGEDKYRETLSEALLLKGGVHIENPSKDAMKFRGMSLKDMAVDLMKDSVSGITRMSADEVFDEMMRAYSPSAAFPAILDQTINKAYVAGYNEAQTTFEAFTTEGSLSDFKTSRHEYIAGPAGEFERVGENGELKSDTPQDALLPTRKLDTYGKQFTMTRQAFINDDIGYLTSLPARYAKAAKSSINKQVYEILFKNPTIYDGSTLFGAHHKNVVTKGALIGAPTSAAIQAMIVALSTQKNQFGEPIALRPGAIIVPVGYGFGIQTIFESATINTADNTQAANPLYKYRSQIQVVEDPTLNALAGENEVPWFMAAGKADAAGIQVDYLNGQKMPTIRRMEKPGVLGFVWDIYMDWGITVTDFRGLIKNPGAKIDTSI